MKIDDNGLRRLFRESVLEKHPETRKKCPAQKNIEAFFRPGISRRKKRRTIDHVTSCSLCFEEFSFLLEIHRDQNSLLENSDVTTFGSIPRAGILRYVPLAAGILLFAFISLFVFKYFPESHSRGDNENTILLKQPSGQASLTTPLIFKWDTDFEADYYILELFDPDLSPFLRITDIPTNHYFLPRDIQRHMKHDEPYYWMISAVFSDGSVKESKLMKFLLIQ